MKQQEKSDATATFLLTAQGVLVVRLKPVDKHGLAEAQAGVSVLTEMGAGEKRPLLVDMTEVRTVGNDARQYYAEQTEKFATRCALVTNSTVGTIIANFFLTVNKPRCPTRLFTTQNEAMAWLQKGLPAKAPKDVAMGAAE